MVVALESLPERLGPLRKLMKMKTEHLGSPLKLTKMKMGLARPPSLPLRMRESHYCARSRGYLSLSFDVSWYSDVKEGSQLKRKRSSWDNNEDEDGHLLETSGPRMENKRFRFQFTKDQHIALPSLMATEAQLTEPEVATGTETSGTAIAPGFTGEEATGAATFNTGLTLGFSEGAAGAGTLEMLVVPAAAEPTQAALAETTLNDVPALVAVLDANEETGTVCPFDGCTARFTLRTLRTDSPLGHHLFAVHMNGRKFTKKEKYPCPGDGVLSTCTHGLREYKEPSASNRALGRHFKAEHLGIEISWPCRIPGCKSGNNGQPKKLSRKDNRNNHERRCIARQTGKCEPMFQMLQS